MDIQSTELQNVGQLHHGRVTLRCKRNQILCLGTAKSAIPVRESLNRVEADLCPELGVRSLDLRFAHPLFLLCHLIPKIHPIRAQCCEFFIRDNFCRGLNTLHRSSSLAGSESNRI